MEEKCLLPLPQSIRYESQATRRLRTWLDFSTQKCEAFYSLNDIRLAVKKSKKSRTPMRTIKAAFPCSRSHRPPSASLHQLLATTDSVSFLYHYLFPVEGFP